MININYKFFAIVCFIFGFFYAWNFQIFDYLFTIDLFTPVRIWSLSTIDQPPPFFYKVGFLMHFYP